MEIVFHIYLMNNLILNNNNKKNIIINKIITK